MAATGVLGTARWLTWLVPFACSGSLDLGLASGLAVRGSVTWLFRLGLQASESESVCGLAVLVSAGGVRQPCGVLPPPRRASLPRSGSSTAQAGPASYLRSSAIAGVHAALSLATMPAGIGGVALPAAT